MVAKYKHKTYGLWYLSTGKFPEASTDTKKRKYEKVQIQIQRNIYTEIID